MEELKNILDKGSNAVYKWLNKMSEHISSGKYSVVIKTVIKILILLFIYWLIGILFNAIKYLGVIIIYTVGITGRMVISSIWTIIVELTYALLVIISLYKLISDYKKDSKEKLLFKNKKKDDIAKDKFFTTANFFIKLLSIIILIPLFIIDIAALYTFGLLFGFLSEGVKLISLFVGVFGVILFVTALILLIKSLLSENNISPKKYFGMTILSIIVIACSGVIFAIETSDYKKVDSLTDDFKLTTIVQQYKLDSKKKYIISNNGGQRKVKVVVNDDLGNYMEVRIAHYTTSSVDTSVYEGAKQTTIRYTQNLDLEFEDLEDIYNLIVDGLKDKKIYNYNLLKYGDIEVRVSSEFKDNIKIVNRVENEYFR